MITGIIWSKKRKKLPIWNFCDEVIALTSILRLKICTSEDHAVQSLFLTLRADCNYRLIALLSTNQNRVIVNSI